MRATPSSVRHKHSEEPGAFASLREQALSSVTQAYSSWNEAVAFLLEGFHIHSRTSEAWHQEAATALRNMKEPIRSDFILSSTEPKLQSALIKGSVRAFCTTVLEQDIEFMPKDFVYPKFPYFQVEPATLPSLAKSGLILFANPPTVDADEPDEPGTPINAAEYLQRPMVSVELDTASLPDNRRGAILLNWSCKGRSGAKAKIFIDGRQYVSAFDVQTTDDDSVPNFWTFIPWQEGRTVIDLKHVGDGYLWFEHVDVHHIEWHAE